jgi:hypothetical protein
MLETHNTPSSSLPRSLGAACTKTDVRVSYGVQIQRSIYVWKAKEISFPIPPVPHHCKDRDNGNHETSGCLESVRVLRRRLLGCWPMYRIGAH